MANRSASHVDQGGNEKFLRKSFSPTDSETATQKGATQFPRATKVLVVSCGRAIRSCHVLAYRHGSQDVGSQGARVLWAMVGDMGARGRVFLATSGLAFGATLLASIGRQ